MALYKNITPHVLVIDSDLVEPNREIKIPDDHPLLRRLINGGYLITVDPPQVVITEIHEPKPEVKPKGKPGRKKKE